MRMEAAARAEASRAVREVAPAALDSAAAALRAAALPANAAILEFRASALRGGDPAVGLFSACDDAWTVSRSLDAAVTSEAEAAAMHASAYAACAVGHAATAAAYAVRIRAAIDGQCAIVAWLVAESETFAGLAAARIYRSS